MLAHTSSKTPATVTLCVVPSWSRDRRCHIGCIGSAREGHGSLPSEPAEPVADRFCASEVRAAGRGSLYRPCRDDDQPTGSGGRRRTTVLALDIGGTKLAAAVDHRLGSDPVRGTTSDGRATTGRTCSPPSRPHARGRRPCRTASPTPWASGCGGPMEPGGDSVSPLNIPQWRGFPLRSRLGRRVRRRRRSSTTTRKALARAEGWLGAAQGRRDFLAMVVSTGVGGGIVLDGRAARRGARQRRPHRPRHRRPDRPAVCRAARVGAWRPRSRVDRSRRSTGRPASRPMPRDEALGRSSGRSCRGIGREPPRPPPGGRRRIGGARVRGAVLHRRPGRARPLGLPRLLTGNANRSVGLWRPRPAPRCRRRRRSDSRSRSGR